MFTFLRTGAIASAFIGLAIFATPAVAAQEQTVPQIAAPGWSLPASTAPQQTTPQAAAPQAAAPQAAAPQAQIVQQPAAPAAAAPQPAVQTTFTPAQPVAKNPFASLPAMVRPVAPPVSYPRQTRSLQDMVANYVNFGDQDQQQDCLAKAVYFEARSEPLEGQLAVADVVLNRAGSGKYPPTICQVVTQPWQFSFVNATRSIPEPNKGSRAWHNAVAIADIARKNLAEVVPANVLWYHANYVSPSWGRRLNRVTQIGVHIFYS